MRSDTPTLDVAERDCPAAAADLRLPLQAALLLDTLAGMALSLVISVNVFITTGSAFLAAAVFAVQQLFLVLFGGKLATAGLGRLAPARLCAVAEVAVAAGTVAVVATMGAGSWALYVALALRGIAEGMARGTRFAVLREAATGGDVARLSAAVGGAQHVGRALAALLAFSLTGTVDPSHFAMLTIVPTLAAAAIYSGISARMSSIRRGERTADVQATEPTAGTAPSPSVRQLLLNLGLVDVAFQGYHTVARTALPIGLFAGGAQSALALQLLANCAMFAAAWLLGRGHMAIGHSIPRAATALTASLALAAVLAGSLHAALAVYVLFIFSYEYCFTRLQAMLVATAEARTLAPTMIRFNAVASALVAVAALAIGAVADGLGLRMAAAITAATVVLGLAALAITERRSRTA